MARTNVANKYTEVTHEGAPAARMNPMQALRRSVLSCLLGENEFYEDGKLIADRIRELALQADPMQVAALAIQARTQFKLRHAPLWLLTALAKTGSGTPILGNTMPQVIRRADELAEFAAMYWKVNPGKDFSAQMKKGFARAFENFNEYGFAKYDRNAAVKLRDVLFLSHAKPKDEGRAALYKRIAERELATPDTWEVELSGGADKKETFERLIREGKLGYLALLRNLRNMADAGCDAALVKEAILARKGGAEMVLPFRYVAAARAAPRFERELDQALIAAIGEMPKLPGKTAVLVDVSGSMDRSLSLKSDLTRMDAAATLASIVPSDDLRVFAFSDSMVEVPPRRGMAGVDAIRNSLPHGGTYLGGAIDVLNTLYAYDRLIVVTDEQSHDRVNEPRKGGRGYMINVASNKNGVGYGAWTHLDGFSEAVLTFIREYEAG